AVLARSWARRLDEALASTGSPGAGAQAQLEALLAALQRQNGNRAFGVCRQCAHFLAEGDGHRCGLTGEALTATQAAKICREWAEPSSPWARRRAHGRPAPAWRSRQPARPDCDLRNARASSTREDVDCEPRPPATAARRRARPAPP